MIDILILLVSVVTVVLLLPIALQVVVFALAFIVKLVVGAIALVTAGAEAVKTFVRNRRHA